MIKKLFIALVALSFLVGNFALADNPPGYKDYSTVQTDNIGYAEALPLPSLKPATETCDWQDYTCSDPASVYLSGGAATFTDMCVRFSPTTGEPCHLDEADFFIYDLSAFSYPALAGDLVVTVYAEDPVYDDYPWDDGTPAGILWQGTIANADVQFYPNINSVVFPTPIPFQGEDIFVAVGTALSTDYLGAMGEDDLVTCAGGGSCTSEYSGRSLAYYPAYGYHVFLSACSSTESVNYCIYGYICCEEPVFSCPGNQEWPTFQQSYARTGYSTNTIGDLTNLRILWEYQGTNYVVWGHPIVSNENVYVAFYDEVVCLDLYTGTRVWGTNDHPDYAGFMWNSTNNLRTVPTVDAGLIYFGTGASSYTEGVACADALTGDTVWVRHSDLGSGLPSDLGPTLVGEFNYCTPLVIGNVLVIGNSFGELYGLDKNTGADVWHITLDAGVWQAMTTDGTYLFVGTSDGSQITGGNLYRIDPTDGSITHTFDGDDTVLEGWTAGIAYLAEDDAIIANGTRSANTSSPYSEGLLRKLNAADLTSVWGAPANTMDPFLVAPNVMPFPWDRITVGGSHSAYWFYPTSTANVAFKQYSTGGSLTWTSTAQDDYLDGGTFYWETMDCAFASSCDPYIFTGFTIGRTFRIFDGQTGAELMKYQFEGHCYGNCIAEYDDHDYILQTTRWADGGNEAGKVFCFDIGPDRPRLYVPEAVVTLGSVTFIDTYPQSRYADIFENIGSADMNYTVEIVTAKANTSKAGSSFSKIAKDLRAEMLNETKDLVQNNNIPDTDKSNESVNLSLAADFVRFPGGTTTATGVLGAGLANNQEFVLDPALMLRGTNPFEVTIDADDPDYAPEDPSTYPHADPLASITVIGVKGYDFCDGYVDFGTAGLAYGSNNGFMVEQGVPADGFTLNTTDEYLYHHTYFYGYEYGHVVWAEEGGDGQNHFEPNSLCDEATFNLDIYDAAGFNRTATGDVFSASFIDSLKDAYGDFDYANTPGLEMFIKEYGVQDADFANFVYIYVEIVNRGSDPLPADLYWGTFSDWDVGGGSNVNVGMIGDGASCYRSYDVSAPNLQYGCGAVPMAGNLFAGTLAPTMGAYGTFAVANDPLVYDDIMVDSIFAYVDGCPGYTDCYYPGTEVGTNPGVDMSGILTADKVFVDGDATIKGGIVVFGLDNSAAPGADVTAVMNLANKFAGFGRGDVNNDNVINILDLCVLNCYVAGCGCSIYPFEYLGDVDADGDIDGDDVTYLFTYLFLGGDMPVGDWVVR